MPKVEKGRKIMGKLANYPGKVMEISLNNLAEILQSEIIKSLQSQ